jgi:hypothetical protein
MVLCKHFDRNMKERKCSDYYMSHSSHRMGIHCRLYEWKQKKGVCPYDKKIMSKPAKIKQEIKDKKQKTLL